MSDPGRAPPQLVALEASWVKRTRVALVLIGILYGWTAYNNYDHLRPWIDGTMFANEPTGEIKRLIDLTYFIIVLTGIAAVANVLLAGIAGKQTALAIATAIGIFAVYTALRLYQTDGGYLADWSWWVTLTLLGVGFQAAYKLRNSRQLARARVVA